MAADHGINSPFCGSPDFSSNLGLAARNPFGFPAQPSPFVAHFYPVVNSNRPAPPLLTADSSFASPNPTAILASVAARRRTDILYSEFYKNLLRTATRSHNSKQIKIDAAVKSVSERKSPPGVAEKSPERKDLDVSPKGACGSFDYSRHNQNHFRSFYEGLYNRFNPTDYLLRLRAENAYGIQNLSGDSPAKSGIPWHGTSTSRSRGFVPFSQPNNFLQLSQPRKLENSPPMASTLTVKRNSSPLGYKIGAERSPENTSPANFGAGHPTYCNRERRDSIRSDHLSPNSMAAKDVTPIATMNVTPPLLSCSSQSTPIPSERLKRKRRLASTNETCPACGVTVRDSEMKQHFVQEIAKLEKITQEVYRNSRKANAVRKSTGSLHFRVSDSSIQATTSSKKHEDPDDQRDSSGKDNRFKTFQKVRGNRLDRFNSKVGHCRQSLWRSGDVPNNPLKANGIWHEYSRNRFSGVECPICNTSLSHMTSHDQISDHVMRCAGPENQWPAGKREEKREQDDVDVEADNGAFEEYEWCGQTRVRATALAHRELLVNAPGFHVISNAENEDSDQDLNVETDETCVFGAVQYADSDLIATRSSDEEDASFRNNQESRINQDRSTPSTSSVHSSSSQPSTNLVSQSPSLVVQALRMKIQDLEESARDNHCLICMESYKNPLVSIQCWHVHCEGCWMRALGVKKLCPQCNMITPPSHLRRIFL